MSRKRKELKRLDEALLHPSGVGDDERAAKATCTLYFALFVFRN